jgi:hypothetical protein
MFNIWSHLRNQAILAKKKSKDFKTCHLGVGKEQKTEEQWFNHFKYQIKEAKRIEVSHHIDLIE